MFAPFRPRYKQQSHFNIAGIVWNCSTSSCIFQYCTKKYSGCWGIYNILLLSLKLTLDNFDQDANKLVRLPWRENSYLLGQPQAIQKSLETFKLKSCGTLICRSDYSERSPASEERFNIPPKDSRWRRTRTLFSSVCGFRHLVIRCISIWYLEWPMFGYIWIPSITLRRIWWSKFSFWKFTSSRTGTMSVHGTYDRTRIFYRTWVVKLNEVTGSISRPSNLLKLCWTDFVNLLFKANLYFPIFSPITSEKCWQTHWHLLMIVAFQLTHTSADIYHEQLKKNIELEPSINWFPSYPILQLFGEKAFPSSRIVARRPSGKMV